MKKTCLLFISSFIVNFVIGQTSPGDIMFIAYNADSTDGFAIVTLVDIAANSTIYFTDNEWNGSAIGSGGAFNDQNEGEITWSTGGSIITASTTISFDGVSNSSNTNYGANFGSLTGSMLVKAGNEVIYAFIGTDDNTPTTFLSAIANGGFDATNGLLTNTGLVADSTAVEITGDEDVMVYTGSLACDGNQIECAAMIGNSANWTTEDGSGNQHNNGIGAEFPDGVPASFGGTLLPVDLIYFHAQKNINDNILIQWKTLTEINNDFFILQKSSNARNWRELVEISGAGTSNEELSYEFLDVEKVGGEYAYYRLLQVDFDGETTVYHAIVVRNNSIQKEFSVYPNPFNDCLTIGKIEDISSISIYNIQGQKISDRLYSMENNTFDLSLLNNGIYYLKTSLGTKILTKQ